jgi:hypothetical protein
MENDELDDSCEGEDDIILTDIGSELSEDNYDTDTDTDTNTDTNI